MKYVFNRDLVTASGKGFVTGQELTEGVLVEAQIANLLKDGILKEVLEVSDVISTQPSEFSEVEDEVDPEKDPIEALDPERKVKGRKPK